MAYEINLLAVRVTQQRGAVRGPKYKMTGHYAVQIGWCGMEVVAAMELILVCA